MSEPEKVPATFPPRSRNSKVYCCVSGCTSFSKRDTTVSFHRFPKIGTTYVNRTNIFGQDEKVDRAKLWMKLLKIDKIKRSYLVCSLHFEKKDYLNLLDGVYNFLKKDAVPSLFLPQNEGVSSKNVKKRRNDEERSKRLINRTINKKKKVDLHEKTESSKITCDEVPNNIEISDELPVDYNPIVIYVDKEIQVCSEKVCVDKESQVNLEVHKDFIKNETDLTTMTGLPSFDVLDALEKIVKLLTKKCLTIKSKLTIKDKIVLTLIKLKQNLSYSVLSIIFQVCSKDSCRKIFLRMIKILSLALHRVIYWPSKEEILKNIPQCFHDFSNVRAVIDVIEINTVCPQNTCCQVASYSSDKNSNIIRFMTAVSPGGLIIFISKPFLGSASDRAIFEKSQMIKVLEKGDALMTDKGFLIDDLCLEHGIQLIRPPFLRNKKQFSSEEAILNAKIAKARVIIKKCNQRLKAFKILSTKLPSSLVSQMNKIFLIICAIVNLSPPILSDDKF